MRCIRHLSYIAVLLLAAGRLHLTEGCTQHVDVVVIMDGSDGVNLTEWQHLRDLSVDFLESKAASATSTINAALYSSGRVLVTTDGLRSNMSDVAQRAAAWGDVTLDENFFMHVALTQAGTDLLSETGNYPRVLILMASKSTSFTDFSKAGADKAKRLGITIYGIALKGVDTTELTSLTGSPDRVLTLTEPLAAPALPYIDLDLCGVTQTPPTTDPPTTTVAPTTDAPNTDSGTTDAPSTGAPTTDSQSTKAPTLDSPTTNSPTTDAPTTDSPTSEAPTTNSPTTVVVTTNAPTSNPATTNSPSSLVPTTDAPTTRLPTTDSLTNAPSTTAGPGPTTINPTTINPTTTATNDQTTASSSTTPSLHSHPQTTTVDSSRTDPQTTNSQSTKHQPTSPPSTDPPSTINPQTSSPPKTNPSTADDLATDSNTHRTTHSSPNMQSSTNDFNTASTSQIPQTSAQITPDLNRLLADCVGSMITSPNDRYITDQCVPTEWMLVCGLSLLEFKDATRQVNTFLNRQKHCSINIRHISNEIQRWKANYDANLTEWMKTSPGEFDTAQRLSLESRVSTAWRADRARDPLDFSCPYVLDLTEAYSDVLGAEGQAREPMRQMLTQRRVACAWDVRTVSDSSPSMNTFSITVLIICGWLQHTTQRFMAVV